MHRKHTLMLGAAGLAACLSLSGRVTAEDQKAPEATAVKCAVRGNEFTATAKTKTVLVNDQKLQFCCGNCAKAFTAGPEKFVTDAGGCPVMKGGKAKAVASNRIVLNNNLYYVCCGGCVRTFKANPAQYAKELRDPVTGETFTPKADSPRAEVSGQIYLFAKAESKAEFDKDNTKSVIAYQ